MIKPVIVQSINWGKLARDFPDTVAAILVAAAIEMILHNTGLMKAGLRLDGSPQPPNSIRWADHKRHKYGHETPLVYTGHLSNPNKWIINSRPASEFITGYSRRAGRNPAATVRPWRPTEPQVIRVELPRLRQQVAIELEQLDYLVPFGVSPETMALIRTIAEIQLADFITRTEVGYVMRLRA